MRLKALVAYVVIPLFKLPSPLDTSDEEAGENEPEVTLVTRSDVPAF